MKEIKAAPINPVLESLENKKFIAAGKDGVHFLDLLHGEEIKPLAVPKSVWDDPLLGNGLRTLQRLSSEKGVKLHLLLGLHGSGRHFGQIFEQNRELLERVRFVGVEANWRPARGQALTWRQQSDLDLPDDYRLRAVRDLGRHDFQLQEFGMLRKAGKLMLPCELRDNSTALLQKRMLEAWNLYEQATDNQEQLSETDRHYLRTYADYSCQITRHSVLPAMFGAWLDKTGQLNQSALRDNEEIAMILGSWHAPTVQRLNKIGIGTEGHPTQDDPYAPEFAKIFMSTVANAYISYEDAATPLPF